jgi:hypothetical protein
MPKEDDKRDFIDLTRKERRDKARKLIFGDFKDEYLGNMWGWKFSFISFIGLLLVGGIALYGIYTGKIDVSNQGNDARSSIFQNTNAHLEKQAVKDSLN